MEAASVVLSRGGQPTRVVRPERIQYIAEQDGPPERQLKEALKKLDTYTIRSVTPIIPAIIPSSLFAATTWSSTSNVARHWIGIFTPVVFLPRSIEVIG